MEARAADADRVPLLLDVTWEPRHRSTGRRFTAEEVRRLFDATNEDHVAAKRLVDAEQDLINTNPWLASGSMPWI